MPLPFRSCPMTLRATVATGLRGGGPGDGRDGRDGLDGDGRSGQPELTGDWLTEIRDGSSGLVRSGHTSLTGVAGRAARWLRPGVGGDPVRGPRRVAGVVSGAAWGAGRG